MKLNYRAEMSRCNDWISMQYRDGHTWKEIENLCVSSDQLEKTFYQLQSIQKIIPVDFSLSQWKQYVHTRKQVSSAITLVAVFDRNPENWNNIKQWLLDYDMGRMTELERLHYGEECAMRNVARYAACFHIAFISLDDPLGDEVGQMLYDSNPGCLICYYKHSPCDLSRQLHSRPYEFFTWSQGKSVFLAKLDDMLERTIFSASVFTFETKKLLYCYPVRNIAYFESDLKYVHIKTVLGNDADIYAKLSDIEQNLHNSGIYSQFIRVHRSFLVNRFCIHAVNREDHTLKLSSGDFVPISAACYKTVMREMSLR